MFLTPEVVLGLSVGASVVAGMFVHCACFCRQRAQLRDLQKQVDGLQRHYNEFTTPVVPAPAPAVVLAPTPATVPTFQNKYVVPIPSAPPADYFQRSAVV
jgi:hypothetical protein